jgi:hypothetical protein
VGAPHEPGSTLYGLPPSISGTGGSVKLTRELLSRSSPRVHGGGVKSRVIAKSRGGGAPSAVRASATSELPAWEPVSEQGVWRHGKGLREIEDTRV